MRLDAFSFLFIMAVAGLPGPGLAGEGTPAPVEVRLDPSQALLVPDGKVDIAIRVTDKKGQAVEGALPVLAASSGKLGKIENLGGGKYRAVYFMPRHRHPQVVIVAAKLPGAPPGFAILRLRAKTVLPINTNKPNVMVTLTIGSRAYGPVRTDHRGRVSIPVEVAPGESTAQAVALDEFGNSTRRSVSIPVPAYRRLLAFADRSWLAADGRDGCFVFVIMVNPDGSLVRDPALMAKKTGGRLSAAKSIGPGLYRFRYTAPAGLTSKRTRLTIIDKREPKINRQLFVFELCAGKPEQIALRAVPDTLTADGHSTSTITARVVDHAGNPLSGTPAHISCETGTVTGFEDAGEGVYRAIFSAPTYTAGPTGCTAVIDMGPEKPLTKKIILHLLPPRPAVIEVEAGSFEMLADGESQSTVRLLAKDKVGNPLTGVGIEAHASIGSVSRVLDDGQGRYHAIFTAPRGKKSKKVRIDFRAGSQPQAPAARVVITLRPPPEPVLPLPVVSVGILGGLTTNFGRYTSTLLALDGAYRLPFAAGMLYLAIEGSFRFGSQEKPSADGIAVETGVDLASLHLALIFKPFPRARFSPLAGIGGGAEFVQWFVKPAGGSRVQGHALLPGSQIFVGCELRLGGGALFVLLRYGYAFLDEEAKASQAGASGGSHLRGNVAGLDAAFGYRLFF
ncbi:MAG TPA: Ig-like domain-containing protein [Myxococcota bacterium]|nr:Ig-like domain-containing protein [Myxococcota bacterium]